MKHCQPWDLCSCLEGSRRWWQSLLMAKFMLQVLPCQAMGSVTVIFIASNYGWLWGLCLVPTYVTVFEVRMYLGQVVLPVMIGIMWVMVSWPLEGSELGGRSSSILQIPKVIFAKGESFSFWAENFTHSLDRGPAYYEFCECKSNMLPQDHQVSWYSLT